MRWLYSVAHTGGQTDTDRQGAAGCPQPGTEEGGGREVARRRRRGKAGAERLEGVVPAPRMAPVSEQLEPQGAGGDPTAATPVPGPPAVEEPRRENGGEWCPGSGEGGAQPRAAAEAPGSPGCPGSSEAPEPPEGGWGWVVMLAAMWCNGAVFGIQNSCGVLFVSMLRLFGSSEDKQLVFKTGEGRRGKGSGWFPARSTSGLPLLQPGRCPGGGLPLRSSVSEPRGPPEPDPSGGQGRAGACWGAREYPRGDPARVRAGSPAPRAATFGVSGEKLQGRSRCALASTTTASVGIRSRALWLITHASGRRNLYSPAPVSLKVI